MNENEIDIGKLLVDHERRISKLETSVENTMQELKNIKKDIKEIKETISGNEGKGGLKSDISYIKGKFASFKYLIAYISSLSGIVGGLLAYIITKLI